MKNRQKRTLAMLTVCVMLLSLCACTNSEIPASDQIQATTFAEHIQTEPSKETEAPAEPTTEPETEPASEQTQPAPEETVSDTKPVEPENQPQAPLHGFHDSSFFNDSNNYMTVGEISIRPGHVYYDGNNLVAECFVINGTDDTVYNINVNDLSLYNDFGLNCSAYFGMLEDAVIAPHSYITWTFYFNADYISSYGWLEILKYSARVEYNY